jgi:hypothetical protein
MALYLAHDNEQNPSQDGGGKSRVFKDGSLWINITGLPIGGDAVFLILAENSTDKKLGREAMKKFWLAIAVMLLAVAFGASGALATYMNLEADSSWTFTVSPGTYVQGNVANHAEVASNSTNPVEIVPLMVSNTGVGVGAAVSIDSLPNLLHQEAYNTPLATSGISHAHVTGQGPTAPGFLQQNAFESMRWSFIPLASGNYNIVATNAFSVAMTGDESFGVGAYKVGQTYTYSVSLTGGSLTASQTGNTNFAQDVGVGNVVLPWDASALNKVVSLDLGTIPLQVGILLPRSV